MEREGIAGSRMVAITYLIYGKCGVGGHGIAAFGVGILAWCIRHVAFDGSRESVR